MDLYDIDFDDDDCWHKEYPESELITHKLPLWRLLLGKIEMLLWQLKKLFYLP